MEQLVIKDEEALPFIYQILKKEDDIVDEIIEMETLIDDAYATQKYLAYQYHSKSNLLRNIVISVCVGFVLHFFIGFFVPFVIVFGLLTVKNYLDKKSILESNSAYENNIQQYSYQLSAVKAKLNEIKSSNSQYTDRIPDMFRNTESIWQLYLILYQGFADNMKEAYKLLEERYRHNEQMGLLRENNAILSENNMIAKEQLSNLSAISENQQFQICQMNSLADAVNSMNDSLSSMSGDLSNISSSADSIEKSANISEKRLRGVEETIVPRSKRRS